MRRLIMNHSEFSIRDFSEGEEKNQAFIFNQAMGEVEPDIATLREEDIKKYNFKLTGEGEYEYNYE